MSIFQCEHCGCVENTAVSCQGFKNVNDWFDWTGIEDRKGKMLCSACGPENHLDEDAAEPASPSGFGYWHGHFERIYLPKGQFKTNRVGNLEHIETGETNYRAYRVYPEDFA